MPDLNIISLGGALIAFMLLSLSLRRHYLQVWPEGICTSLQLKACRFTGFGLLFLSLLPLMWTLPTSLALVSWFAILALAAFSLALVLSYIPERLPYIPVIAIALMLIGFFL